MNRWTTRLALIALTAPTALLGAGVDRAPAQTRPPEAIKSIGSCVAIQTRATTVETPIGLRAEGSCQTAEGGQQSCTATVVPTGADIILDVNDSGAMPQCLGLGAGDACSSVQSGPLVFQSQRHATQTFNTEAYGVRMTVMVRQKRVAQATTDLPPTAKFPLNAGRLFDVLKNRSSVAARLECVMADGDQRIFPIVGEADLSPNIRFVSKNSSEPTFDILTYRVTP